MYYYSNYPHRDIIANFTDYLPHARPTLNSLYFMNSSKQIFELGNNILVIISMWGN